MARPITKSIEVEGRKFSVKKYTAMDGLKIAKLFAAKILPVFQNFMPLVADAQKGSVNANHILTHLGDYLSMETIAETLDKASPADFDYIMQKSLQNVFEILPAGDAQVLNSDGTYGVLDMEHDTVLVLRLVCEAVMWGAGDFFDGSRLISVMSPLFSSLRQTRKM